MGEILKNYHTDKDKLNKLKLKDYPYLKVASEPHLSKDDMGQRLIFDNEHIICTNSSYLRRKNDDNSITDTIGIAQNEDGIDTEDRIIVLKNYIKANM